jgi:hypothetical protein
MIYPDPNPLESARGLQRLRIMSTPRPQPDKSRDQKQQQQRVVRKQASSDEALREQTKTETEQRPYLDTEGGE